MDPIALTEMTLQPIALEPQESYPCESYEPLLGKMTSPPHAYECWANRGGTCRADCSCDCHYCASCGYGAHEPNLDMAGAFNPVRKEKT